MKKIFQYFTPKQEQSLFEKQKTNALIVVGVFGVLNGIVMIFKTIIFDTDNIIPTVITLFSLMAYITGVLFILKKTNIAIAGNILSLGVVIIAAVSLNIIDKELSIFYKFSGSFYTILALYSVSALFASRKVLLINAVIILFATAEIFVREKGYVPELSELIHTAYYYYVITLIIITIVLYFVVKFAENAINDANKSTKIKSEQNKKYAILNKELMLSEQELKKHQEDLELLVIERTSDLEVTNKELAASNEELYSKTEIIENQYAELKTTHQNLKKTQLNLLQADKMASLGVLTAGIAHEINNPLNYIMGSYVGLENYFKKNNNQDKDIQILLNGLKTGVNRAAGIVEGLNQFSRSNDSYTEECNIHTIINNCLLILNNQLKNKIKLINDFCDETIIVYGNMGKLHQVFINILTNSIQSIENEGTISITTKEENRCFNIEISDTGSGISKDILSKIIDPFFTTKDPGKGTGLGLSITYSIIQEHKGAIKFKSENNKGTTVYITFPMNKK